MKFASAPTAEPHASSPSHAVLPRGARRHAALLCRHGEFATRFARPDAVRAVHRVGPTPRLLRRFARWRPRCRRASSGRRGRASRRLSRDRRRSLRAAFGLGWDTRRTAAGLVLECLASCGHLFEAHQAPAGAKDSVTDPGHGGVLARIDSVLAACPWSPWRSLVGLLAARSSGHRLDGAARSTSSPHPVRFARRCCVKRSRRCSRSRTLPPGPRDHLRRGAFAALRDGLRDAVLPTHAHAGAIFTTSPPDACYTFIAAIVGAAGLASTLAAARAGQRLLLANMMPSSGRLAAEMHAVC